MKYKIIEANQADHSIVVRFFTTKTTEAMLAVQVDEQGNIQRGRTDYSIDLPVPAPRGAALDAFIMGYAPTAWFARIEAVADGVVDTSLAFLAASVGVEQVGVTPTAPALSIGIADISPRQMRMALTRAGLREAVESAVAAGDQDIKDWYEFSTAFERNNAQVFAMGAALGVDEAQLDGLWALGATL
jgi:hypothetical protein